METQAQTAAAVPLFWYVFTPNQTTPAGSPRTGSLRSTATAAQALLQAKLQMMPSPPSPPGRVVLMWLGLPDGHLPSDIKSLDWSQGYVLTGVSATDTVGLQALMDNPPSLDLITWKDEVVA